MSYYSRLARLTVVLAPLVLILLVGYFFIWWTFSRTDREMRGEMMRGAMLAAQALDPAKMALLPFESTDKLRPEFKQLVQQMQELTRSIRLSWTPSNKYISIYSMKLRGETICFGPESIPEGDRLASPPGTIYKVPPQELKDVFLSRQAVIVGPFSDEYDSFVSAFVPLLDPTTGQLVAVIGMDIIADDWRRSVLEKTTIQMGLMLVLIIAAVTAFFISRRVNIAPKPVLRRLLPPLAVLLSLLLAGAGSLFWRQHQEQIDEKLADQNATVSREFRLDLDSQASSMTAALQIIAADTTLQKALREGDTEHLLAAWQPKFETLRRENNHTHFSFFDKNRVCLLRLHKPEQHGDRIERFTALEAERTGKTASGIELGPLGTFTLRVVQPVFEDGNLAGYVELGKEIEDILKTRRDRNSLELAVIIRKEYLNQRRWEEGMRLLGRDPHWDHLPNNVVTYASQGRLPDAFAPLADQLSGEADRAIVADGKDWRVSLMPLEDASGTQVGNLLIMRDVSIEKMVFAHLMVLGGTFGTVLLTLLLSFLYVLLHRTDAGIRAQQTELRESEQSYRNQFANNSAIMLLIDSSDGAILDANAAALSFYGYPRDRFLALHITDINILPTTEVMEGLVSVPLQQGKRFHFQHRLADGSVREVEVSTSSIQFGGRPVLHSIVQDITERKQAEEARRELERKLQQMQKSESLGRMAGAIAHLYNNLLGGVLVNLEFALTDLPPESGVSECLTDAMQAARRAAEVSHLMLAYLGQAVGKRETLDLSDACRRSLPLLRITMPKEVDLDVDLFSSRPAILANAHQIQQVVTNLATNAWEALGEGPGKIQLRVKTVSPVEIPTTHRAPLDWQPQDTLYACLEIVDTGCGIAEGDIDKIFDPFFSGKFTGRGLGLAVVLGIVRAHGGVVTVESELGRGSVFRVFFPVSTEAVAQCPVAAEKAPEIEWGGTVLLIDDEPVFRKIAKVMLMRLGFTVLEAVDGIDAVKVFRQHKNEIRCVLSDVTMPRMDGWDTLAALRQIDPDIPVILGSGYDQAQVMAGEHLEWPQAFLSKPYLPNDLFEALQHALKINKSEEAT